MEANWIEVTLTTPANRLDELAAVLTGRGVTGMVIEDEADFRLFLEQNRQYWDYVDDALMEKMKGAARIKLYVTDDADGKNQLHTYTDGLGDWVTVEQQPLGSNDWATSWQKYYQPIPAGEKLYIVPDWMRESPVPNGRKPMYLNPGLTFGTGNHASTRMCLSELEQLVEKDARVLDLGCGSGILSIASLVLGAKHADGVDIDPKAAEVAYENAALNGFTAENGTCIFHAGDILTDPALQSEYRGQNYDLVAANIVADVIIPLSRFVGDFLKPKGAFLCSGIIDHRAAEVAEALEKNGFTIVERLNDNGWTAFACRRN